MNDEKGFITPFALSIVLIFMVYCSFQLQALKSEQLYMKQLEQLTILETLIQRGTVDCIDEITESNKAIFENTITYKDGVVSFSVKQENETSYSVSLTATNKDGLKRTVSFIYNKEKKQLNSWQEANASESYISYRVYGSGKNNDWSTIKPTIKHTFS